MKKINFNLFNRLFDSHQSLFPLSNFEPLPHPPFSAGIFDYFSIPNQLILSRNRGKKRYQIKLKSEFSNSGSHLARLLLLRAKKTSQSNSGFPQIPFEPNSSSLSNYINLTGFITNYPFLKKQAKIINQTRSNHVTITANYAN